MDYAKAQRNTVSAAVRVQEYSGKNPGPAGGLEPAAGGDGVPVGEKEGYAVCSGHDVSGKLYPGLCRNIRGKNLPGLRYEEIDFASAYELADREKAEKGDDDKGGEKRRWQPGERRSARS